jgi:hypothetical protein
MSARVVVVAVSFDFSKLLQHPEVVASLCTTVLIAHLVAQQQGAD